VCPHCGQALPQRMHFLSDFYIGVMLQPGAMPFSRGIVEFIKNTSRTWKAMQVAWANGEGIFGWKLVSLEAVKKMDIQEQFIVNAKGKKTGIILSLDRYQRLMEDLHDLAVVAERRAETPVSLQEMKRRLKKDGIL